MNLFWVNRENSLNDDETKDDDDEDEDEPEKNDREQSCMEWME